MTDLEDRIRGALHDPRWALPAWPDAMPRVRRASARQSARIAVAALVLVTAVVTPLALLSGVLGPRPGGPPSATRTPSAPLAPWAKSLGGEVVFDCDGS